VIIRAPNPRIAGWALAGVAAAALLGGAVMALAAERQSPVLVLDLGVLPPVAPAVAAVAESAPQVAAEAPVAPDEPAPVEAAPELPQADVAPELAAAAPVTLPVPEVPVAADLSLPPPPKKPEPTKERAEKKSDEAPKSEPKKKKKEKVADKPKETAEKAVTAAASAPKAEAKTKGGGAVSPAAYAKAVMKKVRSTKKKSGAGKGTVVVGFTVAADGGLAGVKLLQGSGNAALDKIALDHIRRSAPFPVPPEGAGRSYSFEFVGK